MGGARTTGWGGSPPAPQGGSWEITPPPTASISKMSGSMTIPAGDTGATGHWPYFLSPYPGWENLVSISTLRFPALPRPGCSSSAQCRDRISLSGKGVLQVSNALIYSFTPSFIHSVHSSQSLQSLDPFSSVPKGLGAVVPCLKSYPRSLSLLTPNSLGAGLMV